MQLLQEKFPHVRFSFYKNIEEANDALTEFCRLKAHGFNRGMKGGVAWYPLAGMLRATVFRLYFSFVLQYNIK